MNKSGPIIIIEDDIEDESMLKEIFKYLHHPNLIVFFNDCEAALEYLENIKDPPFLIISDINMPRLNGFQLREKLQNNEGLQLKCIPYLFFSTKAEQQHVIDAYSKSIQGFFVKPGTYSDLLRIIKNIIAYWKDCHSPNLVI
ncbi:MAG: response regulator [Ferruginibacter sp.]